MRIEVRISDNVLDNEDHALGWVEVDLSSELIVANGQTQAGVYGLPFKRGAHLAIGASLVDLYDWISFDATGFHPEVYYDARLDQNAEWLGGCRSEAKKLAQLVHEKRI